MIFPPRPLYGIVLGLILTSCAQTPETMRVCDSGGCSDLPLGSSSFDPSAGVADADPQGRISALEALAHKDPRAAYDLALRFFRGDGVGQDSYKAVKWMRDAAERGYLPAQKAIGRLYLTGLEEMGADPQEAERWLMIAANRGDHKARKLLAEATAAREREDEYYRWLEQWRPVVYGNWYSGYPYMWRWHGRGWVLY